MQVSDTTDVSHAKVIEYVMVHIIPDVMKMVTAGRHNKWSESVYVVIIGGMAVRANVAQSKVADALAMERQMPIQDIDVKFVVKDNQHGHHTVDIEQEICTAALAMRRFFVNAVLKALQKHRRRLVALVPQDVVPVFKKYNRYVRDAPAETLPSPKTDNEELVARLRRALLLPINVMYTARATKMYVRRRLLDTSIHSKRTSHAYIQYFDHPTPYIPVVHHRGLPYARSDWLLLDTIRVVVWDFHEGTSNTPFNVKELAKFLCKALILLEILSPGQPAFHVLFPEVRRILDTFTDTTIMPKLQLLSQHIIQHTCKLITGLPHVRVSRSPCPTEAIVR
jgi:hypothetical protein